MPPSSRHNEIVWTRQMLADYKHAYQRALAKGLKVFEFDGHEYVLDYAKYLIQHLENEFKRQLAPQRGRTT